jgi:hypothetical protein
MVAHLDLKSLIEILKIDMFKIVGKEYTKTEAIEIASNLIASYDLRDFLNKEDSKIAADFYSLRFGTTPVKDTEFFIDSDGYGYKCIHFKNKYGVDHFSTRKALNEKNQNQKKNILTAFRQAVEYQIIPMRRPGYHVDHIIPFHVLLSDFLNDKGMKLFDVDVEPLYDLSRLGLYILSDHKLRDRWQEYHKQNAKLRLIEPQENLSKGGSLDVPLYRYRKKRGEAYD